jgi:serine/threonine protein kinase
MNNSNSNADSRAALFVGTLLENGRFRIERELGRGGFGITYLAMDSALEQRRALKELYPETAFRSGSSLTFGSAPYDIERFIREARNAAALRHEGVVTVHSVFEENGTAYLAMEFVDGQSIEAELDAMGRVDPKRAEQCLRYVLSTLSYVHSRNIIHRDIKPSNIIATGENRWVLIDFGSAKDSSSHSREVSRLVSANFSPLEQFGGQTPVPASDLFALSATVYQMICGESPPDAVFRASTGTAVPPLQSRVPEISEALSNAIQAGLGLRVEDRPQSATAFLGLLERTTEPANRSAQSDTTRLDQHEFFVPPTTPLPPVRGESGAPQKRSLTKPLVAAAVLGVFAVAGIGFLLRDSNGSDQARSTADITVAVAAEETEVPELPFETEAVVEPIPVTTATPVVTAARVTTEAEVTSPSPTPAPPGAEGPDLQLSGYANQVPACDGSLIALVASAVTPGQYRNDVAEKLSLYPDAAYFFVPGSCSSLRWQLNGNDVYAVYYGPFSSSSTACVRAREVGGYVKVLNNTSDPLKPFRCG